ncbi:hypothetical protein ACRRTK_024620 [Alexandromys fortis]
MVEKLTLEIPTIVGGKNTRIDIVSAATYKHPVVKKCCYDGARPSPYETCEQRADRVKIGLRCVQAFTQCCTMATQIRATDTFKNLHIAMSPGAQMSVTLYQFTTNDQMCQQSMGASKRILCL